MAAPLESVTVPRIVPREVCAFAELRNDRTIAAKPISNIDLQMRKHSIIELSPKFRVFISSPERCFTAIQLKTNGVRITLVRVTQRRQAIEYCVVLLRQDLQLNPAGLAKREG